MVIGWLLNIVLEFVLGYDMSNNLIVTAYLNASTDSHRTLDASKYCSKEEWNKVRFDKK